MAVIRSAWLTSLLLIPTACAHQPGFAPEVAATSAAGNGWVEVTIVDGSVPADPIARRAGRPAQPPTCTLEVELDGTTVLSELLRPTGSSPPYSIRSTFQFPVAAGEYDADVTYSGCRSFGRQQDSVSAAIRIPVHGRQTTRIRFDGARLDAEFPAAVPLEASAP
jgi:hypothetical protein